MNICICDDNALDRAIIRNLLIDYSNDNNITLRISEFSSSEELLKSNWSRFDILFLDIIMDSLDGVETARLIRKSQSREKIKIIFTTSLSNRWNDGFDVDAEDYLIKPLSDNLIKFSRNLDKIYSDYKKKKKSIEVVSVKGSKFIPINKVMYLVTSGRNIKLVCRRKSEKILNYNMRELEEELTSLDFVRIHRSIIVNLKHAEYIENGEIIMSNGSRMLISKYRFDSVFEEFRKYMGNI